MEAAKDDWGSNVAKFPFVSVTDPAIEVPALFFKVYVDVVTVALCTASLNVAVIEEAIGKPVAALAGLVLVTVGGVKSEGALMVMLTVAILLSAFPSLALNAKLSAPI